MVEIIGLITISALVWLLAWFMAGESDADRRHHSYTDDKPAMKEPARRAA